MKTSKPKIYLKQGHIFYFVLFLILSVFYTTAYSQVPVHINQNFEGKIFPPSGWNAVNFIKSGVANHTDMGQYSASTSPGTYHHGSSLLTSTFTLEKNARLTINFWMRTDKKGGVPVLVVNMVGANYTKNIADIRITSGLQWNQYTLDFGNNYPDGDVYIGFYAHNPNYSGSIFIDDIDIKKTFSNAIPAAPSNLQALIISTTNPTVKLLWNDNSNNEEGFVIQRKLNFVPETGWVEIGRTPVNMTTYLDNTVDSTMSYTYRVYAVNSLGSSDYSNEAVADFRGFRPPLAPTGLKAEIKIILNPLVKLTWFDMSTNEDGFVIQRKLALTPDLNWLTIGTAGPNAEMYFDYNVEPGISYSYRIYAFNSYGQSDYSNEAIAALPKLIKQADTKLAGSVPSKFDISQNYPNPFNPSTKIEYSIPFDSRVSLKVYDMAGKEVMTLVNGNQSTGIYNVTLDGSKLSSGMYIYRITATGNSQTFTVTKNALLIK